MKKIASHRTARPELEHHDGNGGPGASARARARATAGQLHLPQRASADGGRHAGDAAGNERADRALPRSWQTCDRMSLPRFAWSRSWPRARNITTQNEIESILEREGAPAPVVSSAGALVDALHALGARRIGLVTPYLRELTQLVAAYIEDAGIEVGDAVSLEVSDNRAVAALDPDDLESTGSASTYVTAMPWCSPPACRCGRSRRSRWSSATADCRPCPPLRRPWAILRALDLDPESRARERFCVPRSSAPPRNPGSREAPSGASLKTTEVLG